jgi:hypothetical protein
MVEFNRTDFQVQHVSRRFFLAPALAAIIAELAFARAE